MLFSKAIFVKWVFVNWIIFCFVQALRHHSIQKRPTVLLNRLMYALHNAITPSDDVISESRKSQMELERRGYPKHYVTAMRCYFNAVTCFRRKRRVSVFRRFGCIIFRHLNNPGIAKMLSVVNRLPTRLLKVIYKSCVKLTNTSDEFRAHLIKNKKVNIKHYSRKWQRLIFLS